MENDINLYAKIHSLYLNETNLDFGHTPEDYREQCLLRAASKLVETEYEEGDKTIGVVFTLLLSINWPKSDFITKFEALEITHSARIPFNIVMMAGKDEFYKTASALVSRLYVAKICS